MMNNSSDNSKFYAKVRGDEDDYGSSNNNPNQEPLVSSALDGQPERFELDREFMKGEIQAPAYRDAWFARLFLAQFSVMTFLGIGFASGFLKSSSSENENDRRFLDEQDNNINVASYYNPDNNSYNNNKQYADDSDSNMGGTGYMASLISTLLICLLVAPTLAILSMTVMYKHAIALIQGSLLFGIGINLVLGLSLLLFGSSSNEEDDVSAGAMGPFFFALVLACYAAAVWR
jgi:hypothetical protein